MKHSFLIFIFNSFLFFNIFSKEVEDSIANICPNNANLILKTILLNKLPSKGKEKQSKDELNYYLRDKNVNINITDNGLKLKTKFAGIEQYKSQNPNSDFKVIYTLSFYNKEKIGIDYIKTILKKEPLYQYTLVKIGNETKGDIDWIVDINGTENQYQIGQLIGEASFKDVKEIYTYNSFTFKFTKEEKNDKTFEFWLILIGYVGIVIITFIGMFVYIYATMNIGRNTLLEVSGSGTGLINSVSTQDRESNKEERTTA